MKGRNHMIISVDTEKGFDKKIQRLGTVRSFPQFDKGICEKSTDGKIHS